jgi:cytidine deaminase
MAIVKLPKNRKKGLPKSGGSRPPHGELRLDVSGSLSRLRTASTVASGPELIIALSCAVGTDTARISEILKTELSAFSYKAETIHLIEQLHQIDRWQSLPDSTVDERYKSHMDAGNEFRSTLGRRDAMALLAVSYIRKLREQLTGDPNSPSPRTAYILRSVKKPSEIQTLRRIYGENVLVLGAYSPEESRIEDLAKTIASSRGGAQSKAYEAAATQLVLRDQEETGNEFGQNVRGAFPIADFFVDASDSEKITNDVRRVLNLVFGTSIDTPTRDEYGMFLAHAAGVRSASLGRQVGACICTPDGTVVAVGCNEVPKAGGGSYWAGDPVDQRDHVIGTDSNDDIKRRLLQDLLGRIKTSGWLKEDKALLEDAELLADALKTKAIQGAKLMDIIEYGRAVHAEMAALTDAARQGTRVGGCTLFTTTFPCHNCAKHLLAAGIMRVVYIEAYPKSFVTELYSDSVTVDAEHSTQELVQFEPFVGTSPRKYLDVFSMGESIRKHDGKVLVRQKTHATPRSVTPPHAYLVSEKQNISNFSELLQRKGLEVVGQHEMATK